MADDVDADSEISALFGGSSASGSDDERAASPAVPPPEAPAGRIRVVEPDSPEPSPSPDSDVDSTEHLTPGRHRRRGPPLRLEAPLVEPPAHPDGLRLVKMTKFVGLEPEEWNPDAYEMVEPAAVEQAVIRWRYGADGAPESNSR